MIAPCFEVRPLAPHQHSQAYQLLQASGSPFSLQEWLDLAAELSAPQSDLPSGILTVQSDGGYIHALATYLVRKSLNGSIWLDADNICITAFFNGPVAPLLVQGLEWLAANHGCASVRVEIPAFSGSVAFEDPDPTRMVLAEAGYQTDRVQLHKTLPRH